MYARMAAPCVRPWGYPVRRPVRVGAPVLSHVFGSYGRPHVRSTCDIAGRMNVRARVVRVAGGLCRDGWTVVDQAVDVAHVRALVALAQELGGVDLDDPESWDVRAAGLAAWAHLALWGVREHSRVHRAFAELWQSDAVVVCQDALGFKPAVDMVPEFREVPGGLA